MNREEETKRITAIQKDDLQYLKIRFTGRIVNSNGEPIQDTVFFRDGVETPFQCDYNKFLEKKEEINGIIASMEAITDPFLVLAKRYRLDQTVLEYNW